MVIWDYENVSLDTSTKKMTMGVNANAGRNKGARKVQIRIEKISKRKVIIKKALMQTFGMVAMLAMWSAAATLIAPLNNLSGLDAFICQATAIVFASVGFGGFVLSHLAAQEIYR